MRYNIELKNNGGGFWSFALAARIGGTVVSTVSNFDGINDLAIIEFDDVNENKLGTILDADANVIEYR